LSEGGRGRRGLQRGSAEGARHRPRPRRRSDEGGWSRGAFPWSRARLR
jgi:hypothetical protein